MRFAHPLVLILLLLVPAMGALFLAAFRRREAAAARFGEPGLVARISSASSLNRRVKALLLTAAVFFLVLALARPQFGTKLVSVEQKGADVVVAVDVSRSMLAEDIKPSRLEKAKEILGTMVQQLQGNRIGIIAFAGTAFWQCPLTLDVSSVNLFLQIMDANLIPLPGTQIGTAVRLAVNGLAKTAPKSKAIILITDGEDHDSNPLGAADEAASEGVKIYAIGIGNPAGEPIPEKDESGRFAGYKKDSKGSVVMSKLDETTLMKMAAATGGEYFRADSGGGVYRIIDDIQGLEKNKVSSRVNRQMEDRYQVFLFIAVLLLAAELFISESRTAAIVLLALLLPALSHASAAGKANSGNGYYKKGEYENALNRYREAEISDPDNPAVHYNIGDALYKLQDYEQADTEFKKAAASENKALSGAAYYNLGNTAFRRDKRDEAVEYYKKALKLNPSDADAKYNLEYLLYQPKNKQKQDQKQDKYDKNKQDKNNKQQQGQGKNDKQDQQKQQQQKKGAMSKEDAERILKAFGEQDRNSAQKRKMSQPKIPKTDKDW